MNWPLFFAFLSAAIFGFMNVYDTYLVKKRVKHVLGFAVVSGLSNILLGTLLALFLDWSSYSLFDLRFSILVGAALGFQLCFYYTVLSKHDVSHAVGLIYFYPILVAILSYFFLSEKLSLFGYVGVVMTLLGVLLITTQIKKTKVSLSLWSFGIIAISAALEDFFVKVATFNVGEWHGTAVTSIVIGLCMLPLLFKKSIRSGFGKEFKNIKFTFISETLTIAAVVTLYFAMAGLPATIVSVLSVTQPLFVLFFEWIAFHAGIKLVKDVNWKGKLYALALIIIGIVILYLKEINF